MFSLHVFEFSMTRHVRWAWKSLSVIALFVATSAAATDQAAPTPGTVTLDPARALVWLPMQGDKERQIVTLIQVNGQWLRAAIDTGMGGDEGLELSVAAAKRLGLALRDGPWTRTYAGQQREQVATVTEFRFGALDVKAMPVAVVPYSHDFFDATIGMAVLRQGTLQVDSSGHRVRFLFPGELGRPTIAQASVPVTVNAKAQPLIAARLCGAPLTLMIDTGDQNDLALDDATVRQAACRSTVSSDNKASDAAGRPFVDTLTPLASLTVAGIELGGVLAVGIPAPTHPGEPPFPHTIGLGSLHRANFALDMASGRLALYGPLQLDQSAVRPRIGVQVKEVGDHLVITNLRRGSPGAASALREGDTICVVGGRTIVDWHGGWTLNPPLGQLLSVLTCDGRAVTITPVDFLAPPTGPAPTPAPLPFPPGLDRLTRAMNVCENGAGENKITGCTVALNISTPDFFLRPLIMIFRGQAEEPLGNITAAISDYRSALALGATAPWLTTHVAELAQSVGTKAAERH